MDRKSVGIVVGIVCISILPAPAEAAVRINEIAWMGNSDNANAEWIELFNTGETEVSLLGWTLIAESGSPTISLTGKIGGNGFYLLERTSDSSVPDIPMDQKYTGALSNAGAVLVLTDASGAQIDRVDAGPGWEGTIGGSNETKETAQRSMDGLSWTTAVATPKSQNQEVAKTTTKTTVPVVPVFPRIYLDGLEDVVVSTHDLFEPEALLYTDTLQRVRYASLDWAFGDGSREVGYHPRHSYQYPGEYVVSVRAQSNNLDVEKTFVVTVDDADVRITENSSRGIGIYNANDRIVNLSNWQLRRGDDIYELPEGTYLLPGRTVLFPVEVTELNVPSGAVELRYPSGKPAVTFIQSFAVKTF